MRLLDLVLAIDAPTGTLTRSSWTATAERELAAAEEGNRPALLMITVDDLVVDQPGSAAGDLVLADVVVRAIRRRGGYLDVVGRHDRRTMAVLMVGADHGPVQAMEIAGRVRSDVEAVTVSLRAPVVSVVRSGRVEPPSTRVAVSIGAATIARGERPGLAELTRAAEAALHAARTAGRNAMWVVETQRVAAVAPKLRCRS
ncbi:hypothetical protein AFB00_04990 [Pseudonocardia sp. HH130630-07]|nr:hypothetical protein AFB00_04990 [Pseudonocardia sp. HH130630-07]